MEGYSEAQTASQRPTPYFWRSVAAVALSLFCFDVTKPSPSSAPDSAPPQLVIQTGHSSRINCVVFGPEHRWLASGGADNTIRLWDVESGHELRALIGHTNWIKSVAVSLNGDLLVSGSNDRTVRVWNVASGKELLTLAGHEGPVEAVMFSPDGRWIVSGSADTTIRIWDAVSGRQVQVLTGHTAGITSLGMSPDGKTLGSGSADSTVKLWDMTAWRQLRSLGKQTTKITTISFSGDGRHLASGSIDGSLILYDITNGRDRIMSTPGTSALITIAFIADDKLWSARADGTVTSWETASGKQNAPIAGDRGGLLFASLSRDGQMMASTTGDRVVEVHRVSDNKLVQTLASHSAGFFSVAVSRDGRWLAAGTNDRTIRLWQVATGREMPRMSGHSGWVKAVAFSPDSRLLASASNSGEIKLWDLNGGREVYSQSYSQERLDTIGFSPDGKFVAAAGTSQVVRLLNVTTRQTRNLAGHTGEVTSLAFLSNSSLIASGSTDKTIRLWDAAGGVMQKTFELNSQVNAIAVNPSGTMLAAGTADNKVVLITLSSGAIQTMTNHLGEVFSLAFSPDGSRLASGSMDQSVKLWDAKTGSEVRTLAGASGDVNGIVFSHDSQSLISANSDGSMIVWRTESGKQAGIMVSMPGSNDWLVVTPGGLFDGSHAAWKLLLWRFGNSTFKVAPVESFFNEFYYPGLLAGILSNQNLTAKQDILLRDRRQPRISLATAEGFSSAEGASKRMVRLKLLIAEASPDSDHKEGSGARDLRLFRNGLLVQTWAGDVLQGASARTIETSVPIVAGKNEFTAYAFNRDNVKSADSLLSINGSETLRRKGTAYLVVVGVSKYTNSQYNLNYSAADAVEIGAQLKSQQEILSRYQPIEVISLLNSEATKENILLALKLLAGTAANPVPKSLPPDLLKIKPAQPEDAVIFYFSGHGTANEDRFYLIPHDIGYQGLRSELNQAGLATILSHSVSDLELEEALQAVDVDQLLLIIDACNSGQVLHSADERRGPMNARGLAQLAYEKGMYVLTASQSDEVAFESAGLQHSYLAYALVEEGIKSGAADSDRNGQVFLNEWFDYATERVPRIGGGKGLAGKELEEVDPDEKRVQRPRVFNMRDGGAERFAIARTTRGQ